MDKPIITGEDSRPIWTFDQLLRQRATDADQTPLLAYPRSRHGVTDYEFIRGCELNRLVDGAAALLVRSGLHSCFAAEAGGSPVIDEAEKKEPQQPVEHPARVVALLARTDLDYIVTVFALGRLGYIPFLLSPRLAASAVEALLKRTAAAALLYDREQGAPEIENAQMILPIPLRVEYGHFADGDIQESLACSCVVNDDEAFRRQGRLCIMLHSSGSTGLPKPIDYTSRRLLYTCLGAQDAVCFQTVPMSHAHGLLTIVQAIYKRRTLYLMNGRVPQTHDTVARAIAAAGPEIVWTVPYVLKLLAERPAGIAALRAARLVSSSGSRTPDELGDMLTRDGVHLGILFGS